MNRSLLLYLLALSFLLSPTSSKSSPPSSQGGELKRGFQRGLSKYLLHQTITVYGDTSRYYYRLRQVRAESNFNPRATSDFRGWKKQGIDTVTAIRNNMGAAGLSQFIFATAQRYGAQTINTNSADGNVYETDIYNPFWSLSAMCRYMKNIELFLVAKANNVARRNLLTNRKFTEQCALSSYNAGEGRIQLLLKKYSTWDDLKYRLPIETRNYVNKIIPL